MQHVKHLLLLGMIGSVVFFFSGTFDKEYFNISFRRKTDHKSNSHDYVYPHLLFTSDEARKFENGYSSIKNKRYLQYVQQRWIFGPSQEKRSLDLDKINHDYSQKGQSQFVNALLQGKMNGFFIESGAANGEALSNSLFFEISLNWTGLLIEPNPRFFQEILSKNRKAYKTNTCINTQLVSEKREFVIDGWWGGIAGTLKNELNQNSPKIMVQCFPLVVLLMTLHITHVDYLSLDTEGAELEILKTIPLTKIHIKIIQVEYGKPRKTDSIKKLMLLQEFFSSTGLYEQVGILPMIGEHPDEIAQNGLDVFFRRKSAL